MANEGSDIQIQLVGDTDEVAAALAAEPQPEPLPDQPRTEASVSSDIGAEPGTAEEVETEAQPEVEAAPEIEEGEEQPTPEVEGEEEVAADDWFPDEQEKEFSLEILARYAERYGYSLEQLQNDANLQRLVKDMINGEIALRDRASEAEDYIVEEPDQAQPVMTPEQQQRRYAEQQQRHRAFVGNVVSQVFDPKLMNEMGLDVYKAFGVDPEKLDDWDGEKTQVLQSAPKVGATLARHMVDGVYTALPYLLLQPDPNTGETYLTRMFETIFPGIGGIHERSSYQMQWGRAAKEVGGELPAYGSSEFTEALEEAAEGIPDFDEIVYRDKSGRVLRSHEQAYRKYVLLAKAISAGRKKPASGPGPKKQVQGTDRLAEFIKAENSRSSF